MKKLLSPLLCWLAVACSTSETDQTQQTPTRTDVLSSAACYSSILGKDTLLLRMEVLGSDITGELSYHFFEKDDNDGTIRGTLHGDTLFADYTYQSEGVESVREVAFLQQNGNFVEGYGNLEELNGKLVFTHPLAIRFDRGTVFEKVACE